MENQKLIKLAIKAQKNSVCVLTNVKVGAALLCGSGKVYLGTNIESKGFGSLICAERNAIFNAIANGEQKFVKMAIVVGEGKTICYPCGTCRQVIYDLCKDLQIIVGNIFGDMENSTIDKLMPNVYNINNTNKD